MQRIAIIGNTAAGKSTLARALAKAKDLPYHEVDRLMYRPAGEVDSREAAIREHGAILAQSRWILDGFGPVRSLDPLFERADTIVHIDLPIEQHIQWAIARHDAHRRDQSAESDLVARTHVNLDLVVGRILEYRRQERPAVLAAIARWQAMRTIIALRSPAEIDAFLVEQRRR